MIQIPAAFARATIHREGPVGERWIAELPDRIQAACQQWNLSVDYGAIQGTINHGYFGIAIPVLRAQAACILKVTWVNQTTQAEARALSAWNGNGAVRLFAAQPQAGLMLMERLDPQQTLNQVEISAALQIAGKLLRRLAIPDPGALPGLPEMAAEIAQSLEARWRQSGRALARKYIDLAYQYAVELGPQSQARMVNYDLHYLDTLAGEREPWLAVDPKVVIGDPEFGAAQLFWCRLEDIQAGGGLERGFNLLVDAGDLNHDLTRAWTIVRCVDYWLWGRSIGLTEDPARCEFILDTLI